MTLARLDYVEGFQLVDTVANILSIIKIAFAPTVLFGVMLVAYWALPVGKVRIKTAMPGAAFTTILWMLLSFGVSSYINLVCTSPYSTDSVIHEFVDLRTDQHDIHTHIKPQCKEYDTGKA